MVKNKEYHIIKDNKEVAVIAARNLVFAVDACEQHWPCKIKATHLPYNHCLVNQVGTVEFIKDGKTKGKTKPRR